MAAVLCTTAPRETCSVRARPGLRPGGAAVVVKSGVEVVKLVELVAPFASAARLGVAPIEPARAIGAKTSVEAHERARIAAHEQ